jgi:TP901 family phage tail tape measure protein
MGKEFAVGVVIGAHLSGTYRQAIGSARDMVKQLGSATQAATQRHAALDKEIRQLGMDSPKIGALVQQYHRLDAAMKRAKDEAIKLGAAIEKQEKLRIKQSELRGQLFARTMEAGAVALPVGASFRQAANFQDQVRDIAITGEFSPAQEAAVGQAVRTAALEFNQTTSAVTDGLGVLVAGGIQSAKELERYAPVLAKTATSTRAGVDDLGSVLLAIKNNLDIAADQSEGALNILASAGKQGQFEIKDMARWLPSLAPMFQSLGVQGPKAVAEIGAALQIARMGAGSNDEAANNFRNFLTKLTAPDTMKDFKKAGIDLEGSLHNLVAKGMTPVEAMIGIVTQAVGHSGPEAAKALQTALNAKDETERQIALKRLDEASKLGELFQDMQVLNFLRPAMANQTLMKDIQKVSLGAAGKDVIGADFAKRVSTANSQLTRMGIIIDEMKLSVGEPLLGPITEGLVGADGKGGILPHLKEFAGWVKANPDLVKTAIGGVGALVGLRLLSSGVLYAVNTFKLLGAGISVLIKARAAASALSAVQSAMGAPSLMMRMSSAVLRLGTSLGGGLVRGALAGAQALWTFNKAKAAAEGLDMPGSVISKTPAPGAATKSGRLAKVGGAIKSGAGRVAGAGGLLLAGGQAALAAPSVGAIGVTGASGMVAATGMVLAAGAAGYGVGKLIDRGISKGIQAGTGQKDASLGTWLYDLTHRQESPTKAVSSARIEAALKAAEAKRAQDGQGAGKGAPSAPPITVHFSPKIDIHGDVTPDQLAQFKQMLNASQKELEAMIRRIAGQQDRKSYD